MSWVIVGVLAITYVSTLSPGHDFEADDFAAYVQHASNIVEGRPYSFSNNIPNPKALWMTPPSGYPPVYPLVLAPAYKMWGLNLRALKVVTTCCFAVFLGILAVLVRHALSAPLGASALLILGLNPLVWEFRNNLLSEFPYMMFSFGALLVIRTTYKQLGAREWRFGTALLLAVLLYCAYGTRTIGIALLPALALSDLLKFKRPSRFLLTTLGIVMVLIAMQNVLVISPKDYLNDVKLSVGQTWKNAIYYGKTLSYVWENGISKKIQIAFALMFTGLAATSFVRKLWKDKEEGEIYLLIYMAILISWSSEIGLRGLLPILPMYFMHGLAELGKIAGSWGRARHAVCAAGLLVIVVTTYEGEFLKLARVQPGPNTADATAQEVFRYLQKNTEASDVLIFPKARTLALFTNRKVAGLGPGEAANDSKEFAKEIGASVFVKPVWAPASSTKFEDSERGRLEKVFGNKEYEVYRIERETSVR
jgi:hypothetical protein